MTFIDLDPRAPRGGAPSRSNPSGSFEPDASRATFASLLESAVRSRAAPAGSREEAPSTGWLAADAGTGGLTGTGSSERAEADQQGRQRGASDAASGGASSPGGAGSKSRSPGAERQGGADDTATRAGAASASADGGVDESGSNAFDASLQSAVAGSFPFLSRSRIDRPAAELPGGQLQQRPAGEYPIGKSSGFADPRHAGGGPAESLALRQSPRSKLPGGEGSAAVPFQVGLVLHHPSTSASGKAPEASPRAGEQASSRGSVASLPPGPRGATGGLRWSGFPVVASREQERALPQAGVAGQWQSSLPPGMTASATSASAEFRPARGLAGVHQPGGSPGLPEGALGKAFGVAPLAKSRQAAMEASAAAPIVRPNLPAPAGTSAGAAAGTGVADTATPSDGIHAFASGHRSTATPATTRTATGTVPAPTPAAPGFDRFGRGVRTTDVAIEARPSRKSVIEARSPDVALTRAASTQRSALGAATEGTPGTAPKGAGEGLPGGRTTAPAGPGMSQSVLGASETGVRSPRPGAASATSSPAGHPVAERSDRAGDRPLTTTASNGMTARGGIAGREAAGAREAAGTHLETKGLRGSPHPRGAPTSTPTADIAGTPRGAVAQTPGLEAAPSEALSRHGSVQPPAASSSPNRAVAAARLGDGSGAASSFPSIAGRSSSKLDPRSALADAGPRSPAAPRHEISWSRPASHPASERTEAVGGATESLKTGGGAAQDRSVQHPAPPAPAGSVRSGTPSSDGARSDPTLRERAMTAASSAEGRSAAGAAASMPPHRGGQYDQFTGMPVSTGQRFADGPDIDRMTGDARSSPASGSAGATPASSAAPKPFIRDPFDAGRAPKPAEKAGAGRTGATEAPGGNHGTQGASKAAETQPAHTPGAPAPAGLPVASLARLSAVLTQAAEASSGHFQRADATTRPGGPVRILSITLEPADLGSVSVRLRARGESLEVALKAAQPQTARLLETDSGKLRGLIRDAGFIVDRLTVETAPSFDRASSSSAAGERGDAPSGGTNGGSSSGGGATGGGLAGNTRGDWGEGQPRGRDGRYRAAFVTARGETGEVAERGRADGPLYV